MRKYEPIWLALKRQREVSIAAPQAMHRRIVLAVRKEKTKDVGWKYQCLESRERWKLLDTSAESLLTFTLMPAEILSYSTLTIHDL